MLNFFGGRQYEKGENNLLLQICYQFAHISPELALAVEKICTMGMFCFPHVISLTLNIYYRGKKLSN